MGLILASSLTMSQSLDLAEAIKPSMLLDTSRQMARSMFFLACGRTSSAPAGKLAMPSPRAIRAKHARRALRPEAGFDVRAMNGLLGSGDYFWLLSLRKYFTLVTPSGSDLGVNHLAMICLTENHWGPGSGPGPR